MRESQVKLVQDTWAHVTPLGVKFTQDFYRRLFQQHPEVEGLFPDSMVLQEKLLFKMINSAVSCIPSEGAFNTIMARLGVRHSAYGLTAKHYSYFMESLLESIREALGEDWSEEVGDAWREVFKGMSERMMASAK